jgi:hypothetical protein
MPARRSADPSPDLFSTFPPERAPELTTVFKSGAKPNDQVAQPRHVLPKDLAAALKRLHDAEFAALLSAVTTEARRRNAQLPGLTTEQPSADATPAHRSAPAQDVAISLTTAKFNAVRAAFKAGVKPSTIARQFGISQSDVRKAIAAEGRIQKSGR